MLPVFSAHYVVPDRRNGYSLVVNNGGQNRYCLFDRDVHLTHAALTSDPVAHSGLASILA